MELEKMRCELYLGAAHDFFLDIFARSCQLVLRKILLFHIPVNRNSNQKKSA